MCVLNALIKVSPGIHCHNQHVQSIDIIFRHLFFFFFFPGRDQYYSWLFLVGLMFREHPKAQPVG